MATFKKLGKKGQEKWTVVFDLPGHTSRKQKRMSGFATKSEANLAHIAFMANYKADTQKAKIGSFEQRYNEFLAHIKYEVKESTYMATESDFRNHIIPYFKEIEISLIKPKDVSNWIMWLDDATKLSFKSKTSLKGRLSRFFSYCVVHELLTENPCSKALKLKNTEPQKEMLIWSEEEFKAFISTLDECVYKTFFSLLYLTGCRRGEALALNWKDIDFKRQLLRIRKSLGHHTINAVYKITTTKNVFSNREVLLPAALIKMLAQLKAHYKTYELFSEDNFVFGNIKPLPPETIRRKLKEHCAKAGVKVIRIHDFRHSHASLLISKGHDIVTIARRLGHSDIEMTLNRYAHLMPNKQKELMDSLNLL